jgi:CubicO group peptidase (beta-lactamase class C family)
MKFKNMVLRGYGYQWWTCDDGSFAARGIFGQGIFVDPARQLVIASNANWSDNATDPTATAAREAFTWLCSRPWMPKLPRPQPSASAAQAHQGCNRAR